jgi:integrase
MAKQGLNDVKVKAARGRGLYGDGGGLYLQITTKGHKSWVYRFRIHGRLRTMGLGPFPAVSLKAARIAHGEAKALRDAGTDPIIARGAKRQVAAAALSVEATCEEYIEAQKAKWKTADHVKQIRQRLRDYVYPIIGHLPIADIKLAEAKQVLVPIWTAKNPTAGRVRQYLEDATNWAIHEGVRLDESNPFEVKRLRFALPFGIHEATSHPALSFEQAPAFLAELRAQESVKAKAMQLVMLTATRIADLCGGGKAHSVPMLWSHVDLPNALWTIPDTKMGRPHSVPLSKPALRLLGEMRRFKDPESDFVFPGANAGTVLNPATLRHMLKAMGHGGEVTTHGMRACFKTWAAESTNFEKDVIEACLAHAKSELDSAYHRGSFLPMRAQLMALWGAFLEGEAVSLGGQVVALRSA